MDEPREAEIRNAEAVMRRHACRSLDEEYTHSSMLGARLRSLLESTPLYFGPSFRSLTYSLNKNIERYSVFLAWP